LVEAYSDKVRSARVDQRSRRDAPLLAMVLRYAALAGLLMLGPASAQAPPAVRQVLLLQSYDRGNMVLDRFTGNLRVDLDRVAGTPVNVVQVVVGPSGFVGASEQAMVDFIHSAFANRPKPDLIVSVAGPAAVFAGKYRRALFPDVPLLLTAVDRRYLQDMPLGENETAVAVDNDFPQFVDDILHLLPETTQLFMVIGSGQISRFWHQELNQEFARFRDRLTFVWSDEMSLPEILRRCANLPAHSAIFYFTFGTDAAGAAYADERVLADLHATANAPLFAAHSVYMGSGIVGGSLMSIDDLARHSADSARRLLSGAPPGSIRVPPQVRGQPIFDSRELQRWGIPESRLPSGSVVRYQNLSVWREHPRTVLSAAAALAIQALLILGLLYERRRRHDAERVSRQQLVELARLNRLSTAGELSASIAHELRQPLTAILMNSEEAEVILNSESPNIAELREIINDIKRDDLRASEVITRLGRLFRRVPNDAQDVDLNDVVREVFGFLSWLAAARQITLTTSFAHPAPLVRGDAIQLQQVILNLLMNAIDAIQDAKSRQRTIVGRTALLDGRFAEVSIEDSGPGIPAGREKEIFQHFFTTKESGMGMGLAIVRTIVENHGGLIGAENRAQGGAVIRFRLPLLKAAHLGEVQQGADRLPAQCGFDGAGAAQ
jgi:signal transduction histidine kinase